MIEDQTFRHRNVVIDVEKIFIVPYTIREDILPGHNLKGLLSKTLFFIIHEGIKLTKNKIWAYRLQRRIYSNRKIVLAYGKIRGTENHVIALGPQDCPQAKYMSFSEELVVSLREQESFSGHLDSALDYLERNQNLLMELFHYSPYSGKEPTVNLSLILNEAKERLRKTDRGLVLTAGNGQDIEGMRVKTRKSKYKKFDLFLAGAGSYAFSYILPNIKKVNYHTVIDLNPNRANIAAEKYNFQFADTCADRALQKLKDCINPILIIATYHSTHLPLVEAAIKYNSNTKIFVEKPPVTTEEQLKTLLLFRENPEHFIEIGYNRRYAPLALKTRDILKKRNSPITMTCIIKELNIPLSHWYYWPSQGTRIVGNLSHWIDLGIFFIQKKPVSITSMSASNIFPADEISAAIKFEDNSLLTLIASDRGNGLRGVQEYMDIRCEDLTIIIDDFMTMRILDRERKRIIRRIIRDKGHSRMYKSFLSRVEQGQKPVYPNNDLEVSTRLYLSVKESLLAKKNI
jgi:predicted dehydrogenase